MYLQLENCQRQTTKTNQKTKHPGTLYKITFYEVDLSHAGLT